MSHLKDIKVIGCLKISCPCEMDILINQEAESHLNAKILLHPYYCASFLCPMFFPSFL